jgi:hypothetical protein
VKLWNGVIPAALIVALASSAQAQRVPVVIQTGWDTVYTRLASISADSDVGKEFPNEHLAVCFTYDQYWLIVPIWTKGHGFMICDEFEAPAEPKRCFRLNDQDTGKIAASLRLPEDSLRRPFSYFVPQGWTLLAAIALLVKFMSGPGPHKRFARLWGDPRYRRAVAMLLDVDGHEFPEVFDQITLNQSPPDPADKFDGVLTWLVEQGIGRRRASRELDFLMRYLVDNNKLALPHQQANPDPEHDVDADGHADD